MIELFEVFTWGDLVALLGIAVDILIKLVLLGLLIEQTIEVLKPFWDAEKLWSKTLVWSLGISTFLTVLSGLDIYSAFGIHLRLPAITAPWNDTLGLILGTFSTGILLSKGSNILHDLFKRIKAYLPLVMKRPTI